MIKPICDKCGKELDKNGGILWSPPKIRFIGEKESSEKYHICIECFSLLIKWIRHGK